MYHLLVTGSCVSAQSLMEGCFTLTAVHTPAQPNALRWQYSTLSCESYTKQIPICSQRLVYMRTGCFVHKKEVFAVCLEDVTGLRHSINVIQLAITKGGFGSSSESKDFLDTSKSNGKNDGTIIRNVNGVRRRGIAVYVSKLPMPMRHELWKCK